MLIRVRSNVGMWRVTLDDGQRLTATVSDVLDAISKTRPHVVYLQPLSYDPACQQPIDTTSTLSEQGLGHNGAVVHCRVDPETCADVSAAARPKTGVDDAMETDENTTASNNKNMKRVIDKDGRIKLVPTNEVQASKDKGFRKGMMALRDMKMQWTLNDFIALDSQYEFKIKRQEAAICKQASLNVPSVNDFQAYLQKFQFQRKRFGYLYGTFVKDDEKDEAPTQIRAEAIYEPPQEFDLESAEGFEVLDDPNEPVVEQIAEMLGWKRVGWILGGGGNQQQSDKKDEKPPALTAAEVIMAAELQLEAAQGVNETPFCTVKVVPAPDGTVSVEAFQVSQQCMAMVAEEALEVSPDAKFCAVNETFTAIQEGKESKTVEVNFFLTVVPIAQHSNDKFLTEFPICNRQVDDRTPSHEELKKQLSKAGSAGWTFVDRLADFNLLIYLSQFLDVKADFPKICAAITEGKPLDDGYKLIIKSMAGMEGSY